MSKRKTKTPNNGKISRKLLRGRRINERSYGFCRNSFGHSLFPSTALSSQAISRSIQNSVFHLCLALQDRNLQHSDDAASLHFIIPLYSSARFQVHGILNLWCMEPKVPGINLHHFLGIPMHFISYTLKVYSEKGSIDFTRWPKGSMVQKQLQTLGCLS